MVAKRRIYSEGDMVKHPIHDEELLEITVLTFSDEEATFQALGSAVKNAWGTTLFEHANLGIKNICVATFTSLVARDSWSYHRLRRGGKWHEGEGPYYDETYDPETRGMVVEPVDE